MAQAQIRGLPRSGTPRAVGASKGHARTMAAAGYSASHRLPTARPSRQPTSRLAQATQAGKLRWPRFATGVCRAHRVTGGAGGGSQSLGRAGIAERENGSQKAETQNGRQGGRAVPVRKRCAAAAGEWGSRSAEPFLHETSPIAETTEKSALT